jgi:hypothetical protein
MAKHESAHSPEHCNHLSRYAAPSGAAASGAGEMVEIEAAIVANHLTWMRGRTSAAFNRCNDYRLELLERAAAMPIRSDAEAAAALRVVLKACGEEVFVDETEDWATIGKPEDVHRANILRSVERYLSRGARS